MSRPDGGPAFPITHRASDGTPMLVSEGASLRDYFAGKALEGMGYTLGIYGAEKVTLDGVAKTAYRAADAMLRERANFGPDALVDAASHMLTTLKHVHACATIRDDGACDGCPVLDAIVTAQKAGVQG